MGVNERRVVSNITGNKHIAAGSSLLDLIAAVPSTGPTCSLLAKATGAKNALAEAENELVQVEKSLTKLVKEHKSKLKEYTKNPDKF